MKTTELIFDRNGLFAFLLNTTNNFERANLIGEGKEIVLKFAAMELKRFGNFNELTDKAKELCTINLCLYLLGNEENSFSKLVNENSYL